MFYMTCLLYQALYIDFQVFAKLRHLFLGHSFHLGGVYNAAVFI